MSTNDFQKTQAAIIGAAAAIAENMDAAKAVSAPITAPDPNAATDLIARQLMRNTITARHILPHVNAALLRRMVIAAIDDLEGKTKTRTETSK